MVTVENHIGNISVTEECLTEIIRHAVCGCFGVTDVCGTNTFRSAVSAITGGRLFKRKGVVVRKNKKGELIVDLHIKVTYGTNIAAAARSISHKVIFTLEEIMDVQVNSVNVYVDDMNY